MSAPPIDRARARARAVAHLEESARVKQRLAEDVDAVLAAAELIADCFRGGGKLLICGNGGSAADAQHMAAELVSRLTMDFARPGLPAIALTTDSSFLTAYANDFAFEGVFARQVQALGRAGDALVGISTSGSSKNVVAAVETARALGLRTIALTGEAGKLPAMVEVAVRVPSKRTAVIQESHLAIEHVICALVERAIFGEEGAGE